MVTQLSLLVLNKGTGDIGTQPRYGERRISKELYDELRDGTPDPAIPGKYITDRLQADHIVSMKNIAKMENFDKLTKEQQLKVLNNEEFLGLSEAANKSKGLNLILIGQFIRKKN